MKQILIALTILSTSSAFAQNLFSVSISPTTTDVENVYGLFGFQDGSSSIGFPVFLVQTVTSGETSTSEFSTNVDLSTFSYGLLGSYGTTGVTLGVDATIAEALVGRSWESIFTDSNFSESNVRAALDTSNYLSLLQFTSYITSLTVTVGDETRGLLGTIGQESSLLNFSNATRNGSALVAPVPEPATMLTLGLGAVSLLRRRKR